MAGKPKNPVPATAPAITEPPKTAAVRVVGTTPAQTPAEKAEERTTERAEKPRQVRSIKPPKPKEEPDLVLVRAIERGQYGLDVDIIIRNPGEVFPMATSAMRKWPLAKGEHAVEGAIIIETARGQFELPGWVELVGEDEDVNEDDLVSHGHKRRWHQQIASDGSRTLDVL